ncbi:mucin-5AC-like [Musca vetustissima]|uniref:mucin-5AC-like n=1 Tax=Musca vetustissima TaxID=27455 RepID=UPI002AB60E29|nr:mucin-5AC-like [Musca vetustissima]
MLNEIIKSLGEGTLVAVTLFYTLVLKIPLFVLWHLLLAITQRQGVSIEAAGFDNGNTANGKPQKPDCSTCEAIKSCSVTTTTSTAKSSSTALIGNHTTTASATTNTITMGNSQMKTTATAADAPAGDASGGVEGGGGAFSSSSLRASMKSRRGSRVKVFGLLGQKKASKEPTTPTTPSSATAPPQFGVASVAKSRASTASCIEMIDEEERASLEQSHAAVIRQLELEQMEIHPPLSPNSTSVVTAPLADSPGDLCPTSTNTDNEDEFLDHDDDVDSSATATSTTTKKTNKNLTHNKSPSSYTAVQFPPTTTTLEQHLLAAANATPANKQRPLSEISIASGDTSGILSPTTARAIYELRKRHQADKLSLLSVAKISYLEIVPTELPTESSPESTDEQMAMHLGKKLAQVLSGNTAGAGGVANAGVGTGVNTNSAGTPGSPLPDNGNYFIAATTPTTPATNELFNIAKAKKIELPSLSSRLVASAAAPSLDSHALHSTASTDAKHLPTLQSSSSTPSLSSLHSNTTQIGGGGAAAAYPGTPTHSTETQSTVIISFKSSQTPVLSQTQLPGVNAPPTPPDETFSHDLPPTTPLNNNDNAEPTMPPTVSLSSSIIGATSQMGSPLPPCTPRNNVLKKVASFTAEKAAAGSASKINNGDSCCGMAGPYESNGLRRSSFVPEKLSFAAYEKFEETFGSIADGRRDVNITNTTNKASIDLK